jgi:hypothetical protein
MIFSIIILSLQLKASESNKVYSYNGLLEPNLSFFLQKNYTKRNSLTLKKVYDLFYM